MELKAYFSNIHTVIINHLDQAESEIVAAIAWFTDRDIFEVLCKKAHGGISVSVALIGDEINQGPSGLNFKRLSNFGGRVNFLPPGSRDEPTMHHKFCVIDRRTVITGSYNWSHKARSNDENITIVTNAMDFASRYFDTFDKLLARSDHSAPIVVDEDAARRRLEMIRNLVLLGEQDAVSPHLHKLRPIAEQLQLVEIIAALDNGEFKVALEYIGTYLSKATALLLAGFADISALRFELETLELRLESLSDEKADLERCLITFNRRHDDALGGLIQQVLKARAELALLVAATQKSCGEHAEAEEAAYQAQKAYREYSDQHEELQSTEPLPMLNDEAELELKGLYRRACNLCHPDKVTEERKEAAHNTFVQLQDAYKSNDLAQVREIYEALKNGGRLEARSTTLSEAEALRAAIAELEFAITLLITELKSLQKSEGVKMMTCAGHSEADWQYFFVRQKKTLEMELESIVSEIAAKRNAEVEAL